MGIEFIDIESEKIALLRGTDTRIASVQEAAELLVNCLYLDCNKIILREEQLPDRFFDLKTGVAGDLLQKFSTYSGRLAIIGNFTKFNSKSLEDFIRESNRLGRISFVSDEEAAIKALVG